MQYAPASRVLLTWGRAWITLPFNLQYILLLTALAIPAILLLVLGRTLFRRDRMLT